MTEAINAQINAELWSAYLYLSMSADFASKGFPGFAHWMYLQFEEEQEHAMKLLNYMVERGAKPELRPIDEVQTEWKTPLAAFQETLEHERVVTGLINDLYTLALEEKDYATQSMLTWFIDEQVEEEDTAQGVVDSLELIGNNGSGLYKLDRDLGKRVDEEEEE